MAARTQRTPRPPRAPVAPLDPFAVLDQTHREVIAQLGQLERAVERLRSQQEIDPATREAAAAICAFFWGPARQHHADEEEHVFPALLQSRDTDLVQHVLRLQQDHGWIEEDWLELAPLLQGIAEGYLGCDIDELTHGVGVLDALYREHIALEETLIYPEARRRMAVSRR